MNCVLRKWRLSDGKELAAALNNKQILNNLRDGLPFPYTERDARDYIKTMLAASESDTFARAITLDGRVIGSIGAFRQENIHSRTAELGYYLAEAYWGRGIMTDAIRQLRVYGAFDGERLVGVLCMRAPQHIGGFFVEAAYHRRGIGRRLFEAMRQDYETQVFTVNASPYAVETYRRLGFAATDIEQLTDGLRYTPMRFAQKEGIL